jgi:NAD(P)-dependent dehydrogenase (short-subunit alcohol dehydrogenase family)
MRVIISGANRGLGLEFVRRLLERGDRVFAGCRNPDQAEALNQLKAEHSSALSIFGLDISDHASIRAFAASVRTETSAADLLINNAGIYDMTNARFGSRKDPKLGELDPEAIMQVYRVNSVGPLMMVQELGELLAMGENPRIVNLSSYVGSIGLKDMLGSYAYSASKAALNMFTKLLSLDLAPKGISVVSVHPGWVNTDMGGDGAPVKVEDSIADLLAVIDNLQPQQTGKFFNFDGKIMPW